MKTELTELERKVANSIANCNFEEGCDTSMLAEALELPINTVKGVLGSLTKKKVTCSTSEEVNFETVENIYLVGMEGIYYWDEFTKEEYNEKVQAILG